MPQTVLTHLVRVKKAESAYVYSIFESHEGVLSYSTLSGSVHDTFRDLELTIPVSRQLEANRLLESLEPFLTPLKSPMEKPS